MSKNKISDSLFLTLGLLIQVVTFYITNTHFPPSLGEQGGLLSLLSGCLGICSVCLASQGNIFTYLFGFAQVITYSYLCWTQRFYGEMAINAYYFGTMIYGVVVWKRRLRTDSSTITPRSLPLKVITLLIIATVIVSGLAGWALAAFTDDTQPYLDAYTTVPALVAQALMILVYREHWFVWLAVDVLSVALWLRAGDYCMVAQYAFWCVNCLYGLRRWSSLAK